MAGEVVNPGYRPAKVRDLRELHPDDRELYLKHPDGKYRLHPGLVAQRREHDAELAAKDSELTRVGAQLAEYAISDEIRAAAKAEGVPSALGVAAAALFRETVGVHKLTDGRIVAGEHGASVDFAFSAWLESDAGKPYRGSPPESETESGFFSQQIRNMCRR